MFERNRIDNGAQQSTVPAELTLNSGDIIKGKFVISSSKPIVAVLNGDAQFLEFETYDGERSLIAKAIIAAIRLVPVAPATSLQARMRDTESFNPYAVLGVTPEASWDEVRHAYVTLSKAYHPDCFAGVALPSEVRDYLSAMARRINAAHEALEAPQKAKVLAKTEKAVPIYTSSQRL
ncbi:MAG: DnaJ family molecular chaperone [Hyphomicrobium sp.]